MPRAACSTDEFALSTTTHSGQGELSVNPVASTQASAQAPLPSSFSHPARLPQNKPSQALPVGKVHNQVEQRPDEVQTCLLKHVVLQLGLQPIKCRLRQRGQDRDA